MPEALLSILSTLSEDPTKNFRLQKITEIAGVALSFDLKPIPGDWNGAGAHTNYREIYKLQVCMLEVIVYNLKVQTPDIVAELKCLLKLLTFCMLFSKKPFPVFLESVGYSEADVLLQKPKAGGG